MVYKEHLIEIWVNGKKLELESQESINLRFQNTLYDPTKISSTQAEYSFEFEVPSTPHNNEVFNYANVISKLNKFHTRWNAEVIADGTRIFQGTLTLNGYKGGAYKCNLVSVKVYSLEDIFGDAVMTDIRLPYTKDSDNTNHWSIPFNGCGSINSYNYGNWVTNGEVSFPLVGYGVFQKSPVSGDSVANTYTSKFDLDEWNRWYVESFPPSLNVLATMKRAFEWKGYKVGGDAFMDKYLKDIYMSTNLAEGQSPDYNVGNPRFGSVSLSTVLETSGATNYQQQLNFPYFKVYGNIETGLGGDLSTQTEYNFDSIRLYDALGEGTVTVNSPTYMYQPNERLIVIPASGFYKIEMRVTSTLVQSGTLSVNHHLYDPVNRTFYDGVVDLPVGFSENTPIEIALVKNYEDNYELIKGKRNKNYVDGNPTHDTYSDGNESYSNVNDWLTCFPHEDAYNSTLPTKQNDLTLYNTQGTRREDGSDSHHVGPTRGTNVEGHTSYYHDGEGTTIVHGNEGRRWRQGNLGYVYNDGEIMAYDQAVSDAFICGFSSFYGGITSVRKNGYSWSKSNADKNEAFYPEVGYSFMKRNEDTGDIDYTQTIYNENEYINTPVSYVSATDTTMNGYVSCMVYLKKNDILQLKEIHRGLDKSYSTTTNISLDITAASPRSYFELKKSNYEYYSPTEFDIELNLADFLNKETKISDWIQGILDAFNLVLRQEADSVTIDTTKKFDRNLQGVVDIDDRINTADAESKMIEYPRSMAVKYKIDTDEWGAERSAVLANGGDESILNNDDWKKYIDSGYTIIKLNDDTYATNTSEKNLQFSYTWYDNFTWYNVGSAFTRINDETRAIKIPVISKYSYMIDGYDYEESMKHDGYGLSQRFWFKPRLAGCVVWTRTYPAEAVILYTPTNQWVNNLNSWELNLSYKNTEMSLLTQYFNVGSYLSSNLVELEVYLSSDEYNRIRNGSMVHFDSDLYWTTEVEGYDPSGYNATTLRLLKKVV